MLTALPGFGNPNGKIVSLLIRNGPDVRKLERRNCISMQSCIEGGKIL